MSSIRRIRKIARSLPGALRLYEWCEFYLQNLKIEQEQRYYDKQWSIKNANYRLPGTAETWVKVRNELAERSITWPPAERAYNVVFLTSRGNWELESIPPELKKIGQYESYVVQERGYSIIPSKESRNNLAQDLI